MDTEEVYISDKYLSSEEVAQYENGRPLSFFKDLSKNESKIRYELAMLNQISMTEEHEAALIPHIRGETSHLNRYSDILPYKHTAVSLDPNEGTGENDYINANYIPGPLGEKNKFIACQGPKKNTVKDFWRMVRQENIGLILMLCKVEEDGRPKCEQYWPSQDSPLSYSDINLEIQCESDNAETNHLYNREFRLVDTDKNEVISTVKQIHYTGWPDHGVPKKEEFSDFEKLVENSIEEYNNIKDEDNTRKILLH